MLLVLGAARQRNKTPCLCWVPVLSFWLPSTPSVQAQTPSPRSLTKHLILSPWLFSAFSVHPVIIARHRVAYLEGIPVLSRLLETFPWSPCPTEESPNQRPTSLYHLRQTTPLPENGATSQTRPTMAPVYASTSTICSHWRLIPHLRLWKMFTSYKAQMLPLLCCCSSYLLYTPTQDAPQCWCLFSAYLSQALTQASRLFLNTSHLPAGPQRHHISTLRHSPSSQHMPICHQPSLGEQNGSREAGPLHLGCLVHYRTSCLSTPTFPIHRRPWDGRRGVAVQWWPRGNRGRGSASTPGLPSRGHFSVPDHSTLS